MAKCLERADWFAAPWLCGKVAEVDGVVRGFAFSGKLNEIYGCNFICITDTNLRGLPQVLRVALMSEFDDLTRFNDATDSGRPGLRDFKQGILPVEMHHVYRASSA